MSKKLFLIAATTLLLAGCSLLPSTNNAATDNTSNSKTPDSQISGVSPVPSPSLTPNDLNEVSTYEKSQSTSTGNDVSSLEKDLNSTTIPNDNLTDIVAN